MKMPSLSSPHRFFTGRWLRASALGLLGLAGEARALDIYMKIEGIPGEISAGRFAGWSACQRVNASVTVPPIVPPATAPDHTLFGVVVTKACDKSSPELMGRCASGGTIPRVTLGFIDGQTPYFRITLLDVKIAGFSQIADASQLVEELSFAYQKIEWSTTDREGDGGGLKATVDTTTLAGESKPRLPFRASLGQSPADGLLHITCPVESGHTYRVRSNASLDGPWQTVSEFTATADGIAGQAVRIAGGALFYRVEEVE